LRSFRTATFAELAVAISHAGIVVLDVRRDNERAEDRIGGSTHIALHELEARLDEVPDGEVWVHCASGYRAAARPDRPHRRGDRRRVDRRRRPRRLARHVGLTLDREGNR